MNKPLLLILAFCASTLVGCNTFYLSNQSLMEQFANSGTEKKSMFAIIPPYINFPGVVSGNTLQQITCVDKKGQERTINITRHTGIRITKKDGGRSTFYFNTLILKDSLISGSKTHFFNAPIKKIKLSDIQKMEIQK